MLDYQNSTRIIFTGWQDGYDQTIRIVHLDGDTKLVGSYRTQYLLRVISNAPSYSYQKWYDAGSKVTLRANDSIPMFWPMGLLGGKYVFSGWSGDSNSKSVAINATMNSPKTLGADFVADYGFLIFYFIIVASGIIGETSLIILKRKKATKSASKSFSSMTMCSNCGETIDRGWMHCIHCGEKLGSSENEPVKPQ